MPLFEYKCDDCGEIAKFLESAGTKKKHTCPKCRSSKMSKMFSAFAPLVKERAPGGKCDSCPEHTCPYSN